MQYLQRLAIPVLVSLLVSCGNSSESNETNNGIDTSIHPLPGTTTPVNSNPAANNPVPAINPAAPAVVSAAGLNPEHGKPGHRCDIAVGAPLDSKPAAAPATVNNPPASPQNVVVNNPVTTPAAAPAAPAKPGMNPAHGQPGHRCDIAVGAPLDSKPAATATPASTSLSLENPVPQPKTISPTPPAPAPAAATAPGMNPPHGQPGHRCDIAVGAPLNSKPISNSKTEEKTKDN